MSWDTVIGYPEGVKRYYAGFQDCENWDPHTMETVGYHVSCDVGDEPIAGETVFVYEYDGENGGSSFGSDILDSPTVRGGS